MHEIVSYNNMYNYLNTMCATLHHKTISKIIILIQLLCPMMIKKNPKIDILNILLLKEPPNLFLHLTTPEEEADDGEEKRSWNGFLRIDKEGRVPIR